jgi:hypothetical protein
MEYRPLGKSWIEASVVSFGAWAIGGWSWGGTNLEELPARGNPRRCPLLVEFALVTLKNCS